MSFIFSVPTNALFGAGKLGELRMKIAIQNRYSMMYRDYEKLFQVLEELKTGFVAFLPLANGLLTAAYHSHGEFEKPGDYRSAMPQFTEEGLKENNECMSLMKVIAEEKNTTPAQHEDVIAIFQRKRSSGNFRRGDYRMDWADKY